MKAWIHPNLTNKNWFDIWICTDSKPKQAVVHTIASSRIEDAYAVARENNAVVMNCL